MHSCLRSCLTNFCPVLENKDGAERAGCAEQETEDHLVEGVLSEKHPACADKTGEDEHHAEPPNGIKAENGGESHNCSSNPTYCRRMDGNLEIQVHHGTCYLHHESGDNDAPYEMRHMRQSHEIVT